MNDEQHDDATEQRIHAFVQAYRDDIERSADAHQALRRFQAWQAESSPPASTHTIPRLAWVGGACLAASAIAAALALWRPSPPGEALDPTPTQAADVADTDPAERESLDAPLSRQPATPVPPPAVPTLAPPSTKEPAVERRRVAEPTIPANPPAPSRLKEELALVEAMRTAIRTADPTRALALAAEHARSFEAPALGAQRDVLKLEALCLLERTDALESARKRFFVEHRGHHLASKAGSVCKENRVPVQKPSIERQGGE